MSVLLGSEEVRFPESVTFPHHDLLSDYDKSLVFDANRVIVDLTIKAARLSAWLEGVRWPASQLGTVGIRGRAGALSEASVVRLTKTNMWTVGMHGRKTRFVLKSARRFGESDHYRPTVFYVTEYTGEDVLRAVNAGQYGHTPSGALAEMKRRGLE